MDRYAIIVAGGKGARMQSDVPKQFLPIDSKPIVVHTIEKFLNASCKVVLVLPADHVESWEKIATQFFTNHQIKVALGGASRTDSVRAGLEVIPEKGLVDIHDAVRPFVDLDVINQSFESAMEYGSGVVAVPLKDSIRELDEHKNSVARNRENFMLVQTPQTFKVDEIKKAYQQVHESHSDDATVYEKAGNRVRLVKGNYANIKITTPEDLNKRN